MAHDHEEPSTQYMSRGDVAELLGVSANTVARWAREGRIPCHRTLGGHRRFSRAVIDELLKTMKATAPPSTEKG